MWIALIRQSIWAFSLGLVLPATATPGRDAYATNRAGRFVHREVSLGTQTFRYVVYLPKYAPAGLPILLYLHGAGAMGTDGAAQISTGLAAAIRSKPNDFPMIVVFPQASERWVTPRMERLALATLDRSASEFSADRNRTYIMGYSVGGAGAWRLAYLHPKRFAALVAVAGTVRSAPGLFSAGELAADIRTHAYLQANNPFAALATRLRCLPISVYHGSEDHVVPPVESRSIVVALRSLSCDVRFTEFPGVNHEGVLPKVLADSSLNPWLLAQRRPASARRNTGASAPVSLTILRPRLLVQANFSPAWR
jgi:predicted peptidase